MIVHALLVRGVATTVKLNSQTRIMTVKIKDIALKRTLASKLKTTEPAASQEMP